MKFSLSCVTLLTLVLSISAYPTGEVTSNHIEEVKMPVEQWKAYKLQHNKSYDDEDDAKRFEIFKDTLKTIEEHNKKYEKGESTYKMGLNHFADLYPEERNKSFGLRLPEGPK